MSLEKLWSMSRAVLPLSLIISLGSFHSAYTNTSHATDPDPSVVDTAKDTQEVAPKDRSDQDKEDQSSKNDAKKSKGLYGCIR